MTNEQRVFLRKILMKSYDHNWRIHEMERAARGLVRLGGNDREISLDALRFDIVEDVLDVLGVPVDEGRRSRFRNQQNRAGTNEPDPEKVEAALWKIDQKVGRMLS